jgi:AraC family transcriptional regulator, transcriptional activator FtrA
LFPIGCRDGFVAPVRYELADAVGEAGGCHGFVERFNHQGVSDEHQTNLDRHITVEDLSRHAHLSRRTLIRRFHDALGITPQQWLLRQRLLLAQDLLETSSLPVERVAERSGMGSAANLRHHFSEHLGVSPLAYRRTFGQPL